MTECRLTWITAFYDNKGKVISIGQKDFIDEAVNIVAFSARENLFIKMDQ